MTQQLPIPDDWEESTNGYAIVVGCIPNSTMWIAHFRGAIYNLAQGRTWKGSTGTITEAQQIGKQIVEGICIMDCQDLLDAIAGASSQAQITELTKAVKELTALLASANRNLTLPVPDNVDYTGEGLDLRLETLNTHIGPHVP